MSEVVNWSVFDDWCAPGPAPVNPETELSWNTVDTMVAKYRRVAEFEYGRLNDVLVRWNAILEAFGGDPTYRDWQRFRPLRLSREEDWSDWLAYLIESSTSGALAYSIFGSGSTACQDFAVPRFVDREVLHDGYRSDIVVCRRDDNWLHVEVKIGDTNLAKTRATGVAMRRKFDVPPERWHNFILLLSHQIADWEDQSTDPGDEPDTVAITWQRIAVGLRRGLRSDESHAWKAFALAFAGAVEQMLLGFPGHRIEERPIDGLTQKVAILQEAIGDE